MTTPYGWKRERLGEMCSIEIGGTPSRNTPNYWDDSKETSNLWVSIGDLNQRAITRTAEHITECGVQHSNVKLQPEGTVLLSFKLTIGRVALAGCPLYTNEAIAGLRSEGITREYLFQGLQYWDLLQGIDQAIKGATLNKQKLKKIEFDFPVSLSEQTKIAEILSTVDRAIEHTEALIAKQQRIKTGLMQDLLTRGIDEHGNLRFEKTHAFKDSPLGRIPVEWEVETLGRIIGPIISGWSPTCEAVPASEGEWAILKTTAVVWAGYTPSENKRLPSVRGVPSIEVCADDILVTRKGPVECVGVVVHVKETRSRLMIPDTVFRMRVLNGSHIVPAFLPHALGSAAVQSDWFQKKIGLADAQVNLNHSILRATLFAKPRPKEQQLIVARAEKITQQTNGDLIWFRKLRNIKTALMQDLLTGNKRVARLLDSETTH